MPEGFNLKKELPKPQEHLLPGVKPIIASVGVMDDFGPDTEGRHGQLEYLTRHFSERSGSEIHDVNYNSSPRHLTRKGFLHGGERQTYVMSPIDSQDKFSEGLFDCTGLVVVGIDKKTKKNISFLTHQDPEIFLHQKPKEFADNLRKRLTEIKKKCLSGTIDAVILGGKYIPNQQSAIGAGVNRDYIESVKLLGREVHKVLDFEPIVINGPKLSSGADDIFYNNEERRLYFIRLVGNTQAKAVTQVNRAPGEEYLPNDFIPSQVDKYRNKWD